MKKTKFNPSYLLIILTLTIMTLPINKAHSINRMSRLGLGVSNQLAIDIPALSMKLQKSRSFSMGAIFGINTNSTTGGYGGGIKIYRIIFDEPQLNFHASMLGALINKKIAGVSKTGFQFDFALGPEFHFNGLNSIALTFEVGLSVNKLDDLTINTLGNQFIIAAIHFYL